MALVSAEAEALDRYIGERNVEGAVQELLQALLEARPEDPKRWLLGHLEQELSDESDGLSEADLHRLFAATRRITSEIVPRDTIDMVISETLSLLSCDRVSLFVLERKSGLLRLYASNLEAPISVSPGQGIAGTVLQTGEPVSIKDCYKDTRFDMSWDLKSGYVTRSLIAVPILSFDGDVTGVIQAINRVPAEEPGDGSPGGAEPDKRWLRAVPFQRNDEKMLLHLAQHVSIALRNAEVYRQAISASDRSTGLLNTFQSLSQDLGIQSLLLTITMHATKIVNAMRATVFLVDELNQQLWSVSTDTGQEIRIPKAAGIAGLCCAEGKVINIPDAYADDRFNQEVDRKTGFRTHSILAVPIWSHDPMLAVHHPRGHKVVGVIQMINKVSFDGQLDCFENEDVEVMELFAQFVGPKMAGSSTMTRRPSMGGDLNLKEGDLALRHQTAPEPMDRRLSSRCAMINIEDVVEEEELESD